MKHILLLEIDDQEIILTPKQFVALHDKMTNIYNDYYSQITKEADNS